MNGPVSGNSLTVYVFSGAVVPVAIGIAILRYRLYDIDRIISRTIAYGLVTAILAVVFVGVVVRARRRVLSSFAQGQTIAVAGSTLAAFAIFQPVRRRVRRIVDRRFDRARYDAALTVEAMTDGCATTSTSSGQGRRARRRRADLPPGRRRAMAQMTR